MLWILDTNVLSAMMTPQRYPDIRAWFAAQRGDDLATTSISQAEVLGGLLRMPLGKRRADLMEGAARIWDAELEGQVLPFGSEAAQLHAEIVAHRLSIGRPISFTDAAIAAIARVHKAGVVTRDVGGFAHCGVKLANPWGD
jgi:toxin FitB